MGYIERYRHMRRLGYDSARGGEWQKNICKERLVSKLLEKRLN